MVDSRKSLVDPKTLLRTGLPHDFDFLNMRFAPEITASLPQGGNHNLPNPNAPVEVILFSAEIMKDSILFFKKKRIIMITDKHVCITDKNKKYFKKRDQIDRDLLAVT